MGHFTFSCIFNIVILCERNFSGVVCAIFGRMIGHDVDHIIWQCIVSKIMVITV